MSEANVELLRTAFEHFARGELDEVMALIHQDAEWSPAIAPILGVDTLRGKEAVRRFLAVDLFEGFDEFRAEPQSYEDFDDRVLVVTRYTGRGERSGIVMDQTFFSVYWMRKGLTVRMRDYETREEALEAIEAGVTEQS